MVQRVLDCLYAALYLVGSIIGIVGIAILTLVSWLSDLLFGRE